MRSRSSRRSPRPPSCWSTTRSASISNSWRASTPSRARRTARRSPRCLLTASPSSRPTMRTRRPGARSPAHRRVLTFSLDREAGADVGGSVTWHGARGVLALRTPVGEVDIELNVAGAHNMKNALASAACALAADAPLDAIARGLAGFRAVRGRSQAKRSHARRPRAHVDRRQLQRQPRLRSRRHRRASPRCPRRAGCCSATWAKSATRGRPFIARSVPMRTSVASRRSGPPAPKLRIRRHRFQVRARSRRSAN